MKILPINLIISLLLIMSIFAIVIFIQIKLSRSENKYLGLIMPTLSFLLSLMTILGMVSFIQLTSSNNGQNKGGNNNERTNHQYSA